MLTRVWYTVLLRIQEEGQGATERQNRHLPDHRRRERAGRRAGAPPPQLREMEISGRSMQEIIHYLFIEENVFNFHFAKTKAK